MNNYIDNIGLIAAFLTTISSIPQLIMIFKTKNTDGLSLLYFLTIFSGVSLWLIYGILINDKPLIFANSISSLLLLSIITMIIKNKVIKKQR